MRLFAPDDLLEKRDLTSLRPDLLELLGDLLPDDRPVRGDGPTWEPDTEELERLRSLGYVQ
jgi:hypothetical protein